MTSYSFVMIYRICQYGFYEGMSVIHRPYKHKLFEFWRFSFRLNNGLMSLFRFLNKSKQTVTLSSCADLLRKSAIKTKIKSQYTFIQNDKSIPPAIYPSKLWVF